MTQPIFRLVENSFYLEENFDESFEYSEVKELLKSLAEEKGYTEDNFTFNFKVISDEIYYTVMLEIYEIKK